MNAKKATKKNFQHPTDYVQLRVPYSMGRARQQNSMLPGPFRPRIFVALRETRDIEIIILRTEYRYGAVSTNWTANQGLDPRGWDITLIWGRVLRRWRQHVGLTVDQTRATRRVAFGALPRASVPHDVWCVKRVKQSRIGQPRETSYHEGEV